MLGKNVSQSWIGWVYATLYYFLFTNNLFMTKKIVFWLVISILVKRKMIDLFIIVLSK